MKNIIDLDKFAEGALAERVNGEMKRVLENVKDPNTEATKKRKIQLTIELIPNEQRNMTSVDVSVKTTLAPAKPVFGDLLIDYDKDGSVTGQELKSGIPGQTYIDSDGDPATDTGEKVNELEEKRKSNKVAFK